MQKTELQVMCLEDLQTHYSQQMDMITINNRSLSNELCVATKKFKAAELVSIYIYIYIYSYNSASKNLVNYKSHSNERAWKKYFCFFRISIVNDLSLVTQACSLTKILFGMTSNVNDYIFESVYLLYIFI